MDFIAIDFETANTNNYSACSLGMVFVENTEIIDSRYYLIKPPSLNFNSSNIAIHGIKPEDVENAPQFPSIWAEIKDFFLSGSLIVAHNAQFDMSVLFSCLEHYSLTKPEFKYLDSYSITRSVITDSTINSLKECVDFFGLSLDRHHNALEDSMACARICTESIIRCKAHSLPELLETHPTINAKFFSELNPSLVFYKGNISSRFNKIVISEIAATTEPTDENHPFYGKNIVLTGELLSLERKDAMQALVDVGAILKSGVSTKTDFLIVGQQDKSIVGDDGLSGKEEKAYALIEKGINIKILNEDEFLQMLNS